MNIRKQLLANHFPEELTEAFLKAATDFSQDQFIELYKFLMTEKASITKAYTDSLEVEVTEPIDYTRAILEAKYGQARYGKK